MPDKITFIYSIGLSILGMLVLTIASAGMVKAHEGPLELVTGTDYAPYADPDLPGGGVVSQIVQRVFDRAGFDTKINYYPWKRSYQRVRDTTSDATYPFAKNPEREMDMLYSRPINEINIRYFQYAGRARDLKNPDNLKGLTYCQPLGYQTEPELAAMIKSETISRFEAKDMPSCFKVLGLGRVDFVLANDLVGWASARAAFGEGLAYDLIKPSDKPLRQAFEYLIISKKHPRGRELIEKFNEAYNFLLHSGELHRIWRDALGEKALPAS